MSHYNNITLLNKRFVMVLMKLSKNNKINIFYLFLNKSAEVVFTRQGVLCNHFNLLVCVEDQTNHHLV